jgi:hypothetical protein
MKRYRRFLRTRRRAVTRYRPFPRTYPRELESLVYQMPDASADAWSFVERIRESERGGTGGQVVDLRDMAPDIDLRLQRAAADLRSALEAPGH